jgi:hypothetical protein
MILILKDFNNKFITDGPTTSIKNQLCQSRLKEKIYIFNRITEKRSDYINLFVPKKKIETYYYKNLINFLLLFIKNFKVFKNSKNLQFHCIYDYVGCLFLSFLIFLFNISKPEKQYFLRGMANKNILAYKKIIKLIYLKILEILILNTSSSIVCTSNYERLSAKHMFNKKFIYNIIHNKVNKKYIKNKFYKIKKKEKELNILFLSNLTWKKNFVYVYEILFSLDFKVNLSIYGTCFKDKSYFNGLCKKLQKKHNVIYFGAYKQKNIDNIFRKSHLLFLPTLDENFGHVIVENLFHYRPCLISNNTPWNDLHFYNAGLAAPLEFRETYSNYLRYIYLMNQKKYNQMCLSSFNYINQKINKNKDF